MKPFKFIVAILFLLCGGLACAQLPTGTILGVVTDSTGAIVADANLTARNLETGQTRTASSGSDGAYRFSALPAGQYEITAEKSGFQKDVRSALTLAVAQEAVVNFQMKVGGVAQEVIVSGETPQINTTGGSLGGLVDENRVAELPLNGRNYIDLTLLQPGITQHRNIGSNPTNVGLWYSSNGAPIRSNNYLLDGAMLGNFLGANTSSVAGATLGLDGIREYRVITNAFSAEYGMTMGSQVLILSKGGTNKWSGDVFEYLRNSALDARNYFDAPPSLIGRRLPEFRRNNFGGSFGGPIRKDKTFFFAVYEGLRQQLGLTIVDNVIASGCHGQAGTTVSCGQGAGTIAPAVAPLLALFPLPNLPNNQFTYPFTAPTRDDYGQIRVDHTFSDKDSMFGRYTIDDAQVITAVTTAAGLKSFPGFTNVSLSRNQYLTLSETHIFSPSVLNTARFSYSRTVSSTDSHGPYSGPQYAFIPANSSELGNIQIGGIDVLGPAVTSPAYLPQNVFTWSDDVFYTRGKHSFKFGTLVNRLQLYDDTARGYRGTAVFSNVSSFLTGSAQSYTGLTPGSNIIRKYRATTAGFYGQDDYRILPHLTLNLGLRYEFMTQLHENDGIQASIRNILTDSAPTVGIPFKDPTYGNVSPRVGFAWDVFGDGKTALRGGFALLYDLSTYGTGMNVIQPNAKPFSSGSTVLNSKLTVPFTFTPASVGNTLSLFDYNIKQPRLLSYNLTVERQLPFSIALSVAYAGSRGMDLIDTRDGNPIIPQGVPNAAGACVARPAGQAMNLASETDGSATACWLPTVGGVNPNPFRNPAIPASISLITGTASSFYNALQLGVTKQTSKGFRFQSSYTYSKLIDDPQSEATQVISSSPVQPTDPFHKLTDRSVSAFDATHNWRFNTTYQFPQMSKSEGVLPKLTNGWQASGILTLESGYPFTVNLQSNRSASGAFQSLANLDRPDLAPGRTVYSITHGVSTPNSIEGAANCATAGQPLGTAKLWYDPCAFVIPNAGFLGNTGRNLLRGPGLANLDFSLIKDTPVPQLGEAGRVEFRAEFFNLTNHPNFGLPGRTVYAGTANVQAPLGAAGVITDTGNTTSRQIQLALTVMF